MTYHFFQDRNLQIGDYIWIMIETGEGFYGIYRGQSGLNSNQFRFHSHSTGREEIREISKLQRLEVHGRVNQ